MKRSHRIFADGCFFIIFARMFRRLVYLTLTAVVLLSCSATRKAATATKQMPLTDPVEIARSQQRAQEVADSIDRVRSGEAPVMATPPQTSGKGAKTSTEATSSGKTLSDKVVAYARKFLGVPYKLGASGPSRFDCSGYTTYVFKHFGYTITPYTGAQFKEGRPVHGYADLQKGDLVFFGKRGSVRDIGHVGIVVSVDYNRGSFRFIHASTSGGVIESESTQSYYMMRYIGARRILPDE